MNALYKDKLNIVRGNEMTVFEALNANLENELYKYLKSLGGKNALMLGLASHELHFKTIIESIMHLEGENLISKEQAKILLNKDDPLDILYRNWKRFDDGNVLHQIKTSIASADFSNNEDTK